MYSCASQYLRHYVYVMYLDDDLTPRDLITFTGEENSVFDKHQLARIISLKKYITKCGVTSPKLFMLNIFHDVDNRC